MYSAKLTYLYFRWHVLMLAIARPSLRGGSRSGKLGVLWKLILHGVHAPLPQDGCPDRDQKGGGDNGISDRRQSKLSFFVHLLCLTGRCRAAYFSCCKPRRCKIQEPASQVLLEEGDTVPCRQSIASPIRVCTFDRSHDGRAVARRKHT